MRRLGLTLLVVGVVVAGPATALADPTGYSSRPADNNFYVVDLADGSHSSPGSVGDVRSWAMRASDGLVYGINGGSDTLIRVTPSPFLVASVGALGVNVEENAGDGLAFTPDGRLWMSVLVGDPGVWQLYEVDPDNGAATLVGNLEDSTDANTEISGLASGCDGTLYGGGATSLYEVSTTDAAVTLVGGFGGAIGANTSKGLDFDATGVLWGINENGEIFTVDPATGTATLVSNAAAPTTSFTGLAITPAVACTDPGGSGFPSFTG